MGCKPDSLADENSAHLLSPRGGASETWYWQGGGWATQPNSRWVTTPGSMSVLGWRYVSPAKAEPHPTVENGGK